jgi:hypothetical protein
LREVKKIRVREEEALVDKTIIILNLPTEIIEGKDLLSWAIYCEYIQRISFADKSVNLIAIDVTLNRDLSI